MVETAKITLYFKTDEEPQVSALLQRKDGTIERLSGLPMPLIRNNWNNPTFLSIENIDNPNRQCKAGYGIDVDGINGCIFMTPFNKNERVRIYGAYQYSES